MHLKQSSHHERTMVVHTKELSVRASKSAFTSFMSSGILKRAKTGIRIATTQVKTYALGNSGRWFTEAMSLEVTRKWVERVID
jgi:hypothetical protein